MAAPLADAKMEGASENRSPAGWLAAEQLGNLADERAIYRLTGKAKVMIDSSPNAENIDTTSMFGSAISGR